MHDIIKQVSYTLIVVIIGLIFHRYYFRESVTYRFTFVMIIFGFIIYLLTLIPEKLHIWWVNHLTDALAAVSFFIAAFYMHRQVSRPLIKLTRTIEKIAQGNLHVEFDPSIQKEQFELGDIARSLTRMLHNLRLSASIADSISHGELEIASSKFESITSKGDLDKAIGNMIQKLIEAENKIQLLNEDLERKVIERTTQLEQANTDLEAFAYSVSHDLRAPLRHVDGFIRLLYSNIEHPAEKISGYYEKIIEASKRMSQLIDDLLAFSRLGRKELQVQDINLNNLLNEVIEQAKPDTLNRIIEWKVQPLPFVTGDKNLLKIVFENLVTNAIKYTIKNEITFIEIGANNLPNNMIEIFVKDNGVGFDMAHVHKLFGVFQRLHSNEEFEGTGIGLANVKQIVKKHQGQVRAIGALNEGATIYIILPKKKSVTNT